MIEDELVGAADLHAGKRRWLLVVGGNLLLLLVMLGLPWLRGYLRTRALWGAFGSFGACLYGGKVAPSPGLGMPSGHEARFATRALREPGWAAACDDELAALAPEEAIFLMPGIKVAEADLRAAVELVRRELAPLPARAPGSQLSTRPLRAIERLRAGLSNHTTASGAVSVPEHDAFSLEPDANVLPTPTRLPLYAGANARVSLWGSDVELHALATDNTGISHVHVLAGKLEQTRTPRPKLLEGAIPNEVPHSFVWAMAPARCAERAGGCADKALGIASIALPISAVPVPRWLGAHPRSRIDRSVQRLEERIVIAAQAAGAATEVREFTLDREGEAIAGPDLPPLAPTRVWPERALGEPLALVLGGRPRVLVATPEEERTQLIELTPEGAQAVATLAGEGQPWVVGCTDANALRLAFGHEHALMVAERSGGAAGELAPLTRWEPVPVELQHVVDQQNPLRDRVRILCGAAERTHALVHDRRDRLLLVSCRAGEPGCAVQPLASAVRSFDVLPWGAAAIVAYAGDGDFRQVRVRKLDLSAPEQGEEQVPAVCWSNGRGLCAAPRLARVGGRALLGAREGTDLQVLESDDAGATWRPLKALGKAH